MVNDSPEALYAKGIVLVSIIFIVLCFIVIIRNRIITLNNKVRQSKSGIDVYLMKRFDLIPNLVETVKAYMKYEEKILDDITKKRTIYMQDKDITVGSELNKNVKDIFAVLENYPQLKADENFLLLQKILKETEDDIEAARRLYNSDVTIFNTCIKSFPYMLFAGLMGYGKEYEFFKAPSEVHSSLDINFK